MIPTPLQVYTDARILLEDTESGGSGTRFTNATLRPFLQTAYAELYSAALAHDLPLIRRSVYHLLPAYTGDLYPSVAGIANMGEPISIGERSYLDANSVAITALSIVTATGIGTVTIGAAHPFTSGQRVTLAGIVGLSDDIHDLWLTERISTTQFYIRGTTASGTWASGGIATYSAEEFSNLEGPVADDFFGASATPGSSLGCWKWSRDRFTFPGASIARQLKITFRLSDSLPSTDQTSLGIDGCLSFLKFRVASLALTNNAPVTAANFAKVALGPTGEPDDLKGLLGELVRPQIRSGQRLPIHRPPFRRRRQTGPIRFVGIG